MDSCYRATTVAIDAESSRSNRCCMVMTVRSGKVIHTMTLDTSGVRGDGNCPRPVDWILQVWRAGMAVAALIAVNRHRVIDRMTADTERGVKNMTETFRLCSMIYVQMNGWGNFIHVTIHTIHR